MKTKTKKISLEDFKKNLISESKKNGINLVIKPREIKTLLQDK